MRWQEGRKSMGQVGLDMLFTTGTVSNADFSCNMNKSSVNQSDNRSFGKELDKAKSTQAKPKESSNKNENVSKLKDTEVNQTNQVNEEPKSDLEDPVKSDVTTIEKVEDEDKGISDKDKINEDILLLLSQTLEISPEQLDKLLTQMGYQPTDLLRQEVFGEFIGEVYSQLKGENLLFSEEGLPNISKLYEQIQSMVQHVEANRSKELIPNVPLNIESVMEISPGEVGQEEVKQNVNIPSVELATNPKGMEEIQVYNSVPIINQKEGGQNGVDPKQTQLVMENVLNDNVKMDLGIVVPIQNFTSTVYTQMWASQEASIASSLQNAQVVEANIIDQIDFKTLGATKEIHLQLSPKTLGELSIKIIEESSSIVAQIKVDSEKTRAILMNEMNTLKEALEEGGLTVTDVRVDIKQDSHQSQMEQQKQKSSRRIQEIIAKHMEEFNGEDEVVAQRISDSEVDYMV